MSNTSQSTNKKIVFTSQDKIKGYSFKGKFEDFKKYIASLSFGGRTDWSR